MLASESIPADRPACNTAHALRGVVSLALAKPPCLWAMVRFAGAVFVVHARRSRAGDVIFRQPDLPEPVRRWAAAHLG